MIMLLLSLLATITFPSTKTCAFQIFPPQFHQLMSPQHNYAANTNNGSNWYSIKHRTRHYSTNCDAAAKLNNSRETDHRNEELSNKEITNQSTDVPEILKILKQTYPESSNTMDDNNSSATERWIKTRTYLYQYRARTSKHSSNDFDSKANTSAKNRRSGGPLTIQRVQQIISFLQDSFPNQSELQAKILQKSPRILSQYHSIESRLVPTIEFLRELYGNMPSSNGAARGMLYEAVSRNTDLLLVRGVGYTRIDAEDGNLINDDAKVVGCSQLEGYLESEFGMSSPNIAKLKRSHPTLFQLSLPNKVIPVVSCLVSILGSNDLMKKPEQLLKEPLDSTLKRKITKIITSHPTLLFLDVNTNLRPTAQFLVKSFDLNEKELARIVSSTPGVLGLSVEENLRMTIKYLANLLSSSVNVEVNGVDKDSESGKERLRKCLLKHPQLLALSLNNIQSKVEYFDEIDRISGITTRNTIGNGTFVAREDDKTKNYNFQLYQPLAARILFSAPSTLSLSLKDNIIPKIEYLASLWQTGTPDSVLLKESEINEGNISKKEFDSPTMSDIRSSLSKRLREYPQILTLSMEGNIQPTLSFYNMTGYIDLDEHGRFRHTYTTSPSHNSTRTSKYQNHFVRSRYIATSLYNRLLPRWHFLLEEQRRQTEMSNNDESNLNYVIPATDFSPDHKDDLIAKSRLPPLHLLAGASDRDFCRQMNLSLADYLAFKEKAAPRLKFNSQFYRWLKTGRPIDAIGS
mmetsp:Transcript_11291/g.23791  ORF Transcript_11291/g.23791 Transcript_11291/m.23791 type:complete len:745 (+) Transcript_11291:132-2366(+)|eukprot:CAMPEP_0171327672 /NCGR_PEP_ID=MMETSP0878-20121228/169_1 /TAXON_ID=67004 /ORGANISM="Thalassiosira weissflogii, Strain CCMP1336" /LENGTH=744 /DNA_ID=CAMNT_0011827463 /DNA_START=65 /DNA_END=2299 /DNA_ORIENTATION=-